MYDEPACVVSNQKDVSVRIALELNGGMAAFKPFDWFGRKKVIGKTQHTQASFHQMNSSGRTMTAENQMELMTILRFPESNIVKRNFRNTT